MRLKVGLRKFAGKQDKFTDLKFAMVDIKRRIEIAEN